VLVKPGEQVAAGQPVMTLEAMKMEHVHTAASPARFPRSMWLKASR
jgi:Acetyl/propionyl-CoA carboxylase, alpha subunit